MTVSKSLKTLLIAMGLASLALPRAAIAETSVRFTAAKAGAGETGSWIQCPCFRWTVQVQAASGQVETHELVFSTDSLFQFDEQDLPILTNYAVKTYKVGAIEALWKRGHVGVGFEGVTWGEDRDRGYSDLIKSGLYALVNIVRTDALRLDIHSGYDFERMRINLGPELNDPRLDQSVVMHWEIPKKAFTSRARKAILGELLSGTVSAHVGLDPGNLTATSDMSWGAKSTLSLKFFEFHGIRMAADSSLSYEHDAFRSSLGLESDLASLTVLTTLSYVGGAPK